MSDIKAYQNQFHKDSHRIHLNNAGLSPISLPAKNKICYWADRFYQEGFFTDQDYMNDILHSRQSLSRVIGCDPTEIAFFQSTAGAVSQLCFQFPLAQDDEVLTWDQEYSSHLYPWREACLRSGAQLVLASSEPDYSTPIANLISKITPKTKVIAVSWIQFQTGSKTDLESLGKITREKNIFLFVDVMQGLGLHPFEMKKWHVDAVAGGSHKWLSSPVGVGFLALDQKHTKNIRPHNVGSSTFGTCDDPTDFICEPKKDATKFEAGSKQVLEITALGASVDLILQTTVQNIENEVLKLSRHLCDGLKSSGFQVFHSGSSIVNFVPRPESLQRLKELSCSYAIRGPGVRLSPHAFNTLSEIERVVATLCS